MKTVGTLLVLGLAAPAAGQLRIISWNTLDGPSSSSDPSVRTVFEAIAGSDANGIARAPDIVAVQEQSSTSTQTLAALLNSLYGVSTYAAAQPAGQTATDRLGYVYNTSAEAIALNSGGTQPHLRATFRPVGYSSTAAELYVFNPHLTPAAQRAVRSKRRASVRTCALWARRARVRSDQPGRELAHDARVRGRGVRRAARADRRGHRRHPVDRACRSSWRGASLRSQSSLTTRR
jgi:hypothetical protein